MGNTITRLVVWKFYENILKIAPHGLSINIPDPAAIADLDNSKEGEIIRTYQLVDWLVHDVMPDLYVDRNLPDVVELLGNLEDIIDRTTSYTASTIMLKKSQTLEPRHLDHSHIVPLKFAADAARAACHAQESGMRMKVVKSTITACSAIARIMGEPFWSQVSDLLQMMMATGDVSCEIHSSFDKELTSVHVPGNLPCDCRIQVMITSAERDRIKELAGPGNLSAWVRAAIRERFSRTEKDDHNE